MHTLTLKFKGFSIVELLIGLSIGLIIALGAISFFAANSKASSQALQNIRLEYELQSALNLIINDIRRAGYYANSSSMVNTGVNSNPFMANNSDISSPTSSCLLFSYDLNSDGSIPSLGNASSDERFGYRMSNQVIQARATTDNVFSCTSGSWEDITNSNLINVTNLNFTLNTTTVPLDSPSSGSIILRHVTVTATAQLTSDASVSKTLTHEVRIRNDKYEP